MSLVREPVGYDYSQITDFLIELDHPTFYATASEIAGAVGLSVQRVYELLNSAEADFVVERMAYAGKNRADLWRLT